MVKYPLAPGCLEMPVRARLRESFHQGHMSLGDDSLLDTGQWPRYIATLIQWDISIYHIWRNQNQSVVCVDIIITDKHDSRYCQY